jgi:hypothetical protein
MLASNVSGHPLGGQHLPEDGLKDLHLALRHYIHRVCDEDIAQIGSGTA